MSNRRLFNKSIWLPLLLGVLCKLISISIVLQWSESASWDSLYLIAGDTQSYIEPVYRLFTTGEYYWLWGTEKVLAGRMPYYGLFWAPFNILFSEQNAFRAIAITQLLCSFSAIFLFYLHLSQTTSNRFLKAAYFAVFLSMCFLPGMTYSDLLILPDSMSMSLLILLFIATNFYNPSHVYGSIRRIIIIGSLLGLLICLRPHLLFIVVAITLIGVFDLKKLTLFQLRKLNNKVDSRTFKVLFALGLPTLILLSPWIVRNWTVLGRFVPFQQDTAAGYPYFQQDEFKSLVKYCASWGGSTVWHDRAGESCYFFPKSVRSNNIPCDSVLAETAYSTLFPKDSVRVARDQFTNAFSIPGSDSILSRKFLNMEKQIRREYPIHYFLITPIVTSFRFIFHPVNFWDHKIYTSTVDVITIRIMEGIRNLIFWLAIIVMVLRPHKFSIELTSVIFIIWLFSFVLFRMEGKLALHFYVLMFVPSAQGLAWLLRYSQNTTHLLNKQAIKGRAN
jgi:hypothetical protein